MVTLMGSLSTGSWETDRIPLSRLCRKFLVMEVKTSEVRKQFISAWATQRALNILPCASIPMQTAQSNLIEAEICLSMHLLAVTDRSSSWLSWSAQIQPLAVKRRSMIWEWSLEWTICKSRSLSSRIKEYGRWTSLWWDPLLSRNLIGASPWNEMNWAPHPKGDSSTNTRLRVGWSSGVFAYTKNNG